MNVYHGTSNASVKEIKKVGIQLNPSSLSIDNQGEHTFINAFFVSPSREIAYIYESNSKSYDKTGNPVIIELELSTDNIFDLTVTKNQQQLLEYLNLGKSVNDFLDEHKYKGVKQIHLNDFGKKRYEYAIIDTSVLKIVNIPKKSTSFMSLYSEAMAE